MGRTVLIVDDHPSFRRFARRLVEAAGYEVVGEAQDGEAAIVRARESRPDAVLLDIVLPDQSGFDVAEELAGEGGGPLVILTSSRSASELGDRLTGAAANSFIPKSELTTETLRAAIG